MCNQGWDIFISKSRRHRAPVTASISYFRARFGIRFHQPATAATPRAKSSSHLHARGARAHDNSIESRFVTNSKTEYSKYVLDSLLLLLPSIHSISILPTRARRAIGDAMYIYMRARPGPAQPSVGNANSE